MTIVEALVDRLGNTTVLRTEADMAAFTEDWRGRYRGKAACVVLPSTTEQVAAVVRLCVEHGVAMVPQGGNTSLCGGAVPDAAQRARIGQIEDATQTAEYQDVLQQEADLTAGHGILRVSGLISVSAPSVDELEAAVAAIEQASIQASCETRRLVGQQAVAFTAAALPLCRTV